MAMNAKTSIQVTVLKALSTEAGHPAQLNSFLGAYRFLLDSGIKSRNIIFMGDSAGGKRLRSCKFVWLS